MEWERRILNAARRGSKFGVERELIALRSQGHEVNARQVADLLRQDAYAAGRGKKA